MPEMPSVTIPRAITTQEAVGALQRQLGSGYQVTPHANGSLTAKRGSLAFATVHLGREGSATTFRIHGGGLIIGRIVNEFGIAWTVTAAIKETLRPVPAS
jgi:hypothetical protein